MNFLKTKMTFYNSKFTQWQQIKANQGTPLSPAQQAQCASELAEARGWDEHGGQAGYQAHLAQLAARAQALRKSEITRNSGLSPYSAMIADFRAGYQQANQ
jgi:hypothetical protein